MPRLLGWRIAHAAPTGLRCERRLSRTGITAEIDENLIRRSLSPAIRSRLTDERKAIFEEEHPETKHGGDRRSSAQVEHLNVTDRFTREVSRRTGRSEQSVRRDAQRGKILGPALLDRVAGTSLDKGSKLDALAKLPEPEWKATVLLET